MEIINDPPPTANSPISPQVAAASKLTEVDKHPAAIRLLRKYLKSGADDVLAEEDLANCLSYVGKYDEALELLDGWLSKRPRHPILLLAKVRVKSKLGKFDEALSLVDEAILAWKETPMGIGWASPEDLLDWLMQERWWALYYLGRYDEALDLARARIDLDPALWHDKVESSLVSVGRTAEAEAMSLPPHSIDAPWGVAIQLTYLHRYADAIPFLRRRLAYVTKPASRDFSYLLCYMECLVFAGNLTEFERLRAFWLGQRLSATRLKCLQALHCISLYTSGDTAAGTEQLKLLLAETNRAREIRRIRYEFALEDTGELLLKMLESAGPVSPPIH